MDVGLGIGMGGRSGLGLALGRAVALVEKEKEVWSGRLVRVGISIFFFFFLSCLYRLLTMIALSRLAFQAEALGEVSFQGAMRNFYTSIGLECCAMERLLRKVDCHFLFDALFPIDKHPWLFGYEAWSRKGEI